MTKIFQVLVLKAKLVVLTFFSNLNNMEKKSMNTMVVDLVMVYLNARNKLQITLSVSETLN